MSSFSSFLVSIISTIIIVSRFIHFIFRKIKAVIAKVPTLIPIYPHFILIKKPIFLVQAAAGSSDQVP